MEKYGDKQEVLKGDKTEMKLEYGAWSRWLLAVVCVVLGVQSGDSQHCWWEGRARARASNETTLRSPAYLLMFCPIHQ